VEALVEAWDEVPTRGAGTVTVPGALAGWNALVESHGDLSLAEVLAPAIRIAEQGFPVTPIIAQDWAGTVATLEGNAGASATFLIDGEAPAAGDWFRNPDLARTFRRIADEGPETFYGGALGREIVAGLDELGGFLTIEDLANHEVRWVEPLSVDYKGYTLHELPPAGQGIAALQMLKMLEGVDFSGMVHNSSAYLHTLIEAKKLAYADLARYVADPDHMDVRPAALLDPDYLAGRAALIDPERAMARAEPGRLATESDTVYLTVADRHGNMISFINSVSWYFGSGVVVPGTGVVLQNRGAGFVLEEGHPNRIGPNKRPFHTIIPAFVTRDGEPWLSYGVMSGSMQPQGHVQVLLNLVEFGMDPQEAVDAARFRHLDGNRVAVENLHPEVAASLAALGHELVVPTGIAFGGAQAILKLERGWAAGSDPRKDGMAAGN
jgi:gamma-glutamyltranspeptidase/glutathione hydrolase